MDNVTTEQSASLASELIQNIVATGRVSLQSNNIRLPPVPQNSGRRQFVYRAAADYNPLPTQCCVSTEQDTLSGRCEE